MAQGAGSDRVPWLGDPAAWDRMRQALDRSNFTARNVCEALGIDETLAISGRDVAVLLHRTRRGRPLDTLIRLFLVGVAVDRNALQGAIDPARVEEWIEGGLVRTAGDQVVAEVHLLPLGNLLVAFDPPRRLRAREADYVMGVGNSSLTLAGATVRRRVGLSLDLGTGCGILAFLAADHSDRVIATDRNPRAVAIARFNARLNGLDHVECRQGDLFDPVAGCQFDLVVSNPPFVISPESRYIYRDSGLGGDEITQTIVRRVPAYLREGGYCQILCNWAHRRGEHWQERLADWFAGTGCDAWVMRSETLEIDAYAAKWIRHTERGEEERFEERFREWIDYYEKAGIEAVSGGLITMRRRSSGANWFAADDAPPKLKGPAGASIARLFEARDLLACLPDPKALLECRLQYAPELAWDQRFRPGQDGWQLTESTLAFERGLAYSGNVDPFVAGLVVRCDGRRRLGELVAELAASLEKDPDEITPICLDVVRRLMERGYLGPAEAPRS